MAREIQLDGAEITIVKALGSSSSEVDGATLIERCQGLDFAELVDALKGLMAQGFVDGDSNAFYNEEEMEKVHFRINSGYSKELKDATEERSDSKKSKRVRRT